MKLETEQPDICPKMEMLGIHNCACRIRSGLEKGSSMFCIGKTDRVVLDVESFSHDNDHIFCIYEPQIDGGERKFTCHMVNRHDLEILHAILHKAVGAAGFMKGGLI